MWRTIASLSLVSCFKTVTWGECEDSATPVADDEVTPGGTATELLDAVAGLETVDGLLLGEDLVAVTWSVNRDEGSAAWVESIGVSHTEHASGIGFSHATLLSDPDCHDRLELPVVAALHADGDEVNVAVSTIAESRPDLGGVVPRITGAGSYDDATFPPVPGVNPADFDDKQSFIVLEGFDVTVSGRTGWEGSETENSSSAQYIVEFPVPDP